MCVPAPGGLGAGGGPERSAWEAALPSGSLSHCLPPSTTAVCSQLALTSALGSLSTQAQSPVPWRRVGMQTADVGLSSPRSLPRRGSSSALFPFPFPPSPLTLSSLRKYEELFPAFSDSRECKLMKVSVCCGGL